MDLTAKLTRLQTEHYSNPNRTYNDATVSFEQIDDGRPGADTFEICLTIKNTIDATEESANTFPSWGLLARLTNLESRLWRLTAATPLRQNPFLTHWVEALLRLDHGPTKPKQKPGTADKGITTEEICEARVEWIKRLLLGKDIDELFNTTPRDFQQAFAQRGVKSYMDLQIYKRMLEEEDIYDKDPETAAPRKEEKQHEKKKPSNDYNQRKNEILEKLKHEPYAAVQELTHLPVELPYLDFLTTLLTTRTLELHSVEPAPVIISYIQHALRLIERMGLPPGAANTDSDIAEGSADGFANSDSDREYGNIAQSRAVKLLLLFITALIRKELLGTELLYYEIQEICVRYVWIKEVRDFRSWVEEGMVAEQS